MIALFDSFVTKRLYAATVVTLHLVLVDYRLVVVLQFAGLFDWGLDYIQAYLGGYHLEPGVMDGEVVVGSKGSDETLR